MVSVFVGVSVDGFMARTSGALDFLPPGGGEPHGYDEFIATVDALVIGRNTFETVLAFKTWPYGDKRVVVLSSRPVDLSAAGGGVVEDRENGIAQIQLSHPRLPQDTGHFEDPAARRLLGLSHAPASRTQRADAHGCSECARLLDLMSEVLSNGHTGLARVVYIHAYTWRADNDNTEEHCARDRRRDDFGHPGPGDNLGRRGDPRGHSAGRMPLQG